MTNEEEKILEEEEVTLEDAAEEAEELQEEDKTETTEEESAEEVRDIREEIRELRQEVEQLRGGLRGVGHPEMIQTHLDNFLAKIAGETPIDDKPRNSTEFWLNEIAENLPGGGTTVIANPTLAGTEDALTGLQVGETKYIVGTKKYIHNFAIKASGGVVIGVCGSIITNSSTPFATVEDVGDAFIAIGAVGSENMRPISGGYAAVGGSGEIYLHVAMGAYATGENDKRISIYGVQLNNNAPTFGNVTTFSTSLTVQDSVNEF